MGLQHHRRGQGEDQVKASWRTRAGAPPVAVRCQTAALAHQGEARQGPQGRQRLPEVHRREAHPRGALGPRRGAGGDESVVGLCLAALQGHRDVGGNGSGVPPERAGVPGPGCWRAGATRGRGHSGDR